MAKLYIIGNINTQMNPVLFLVRGDTEHFFNFTKPHSFFIFFIKIEYSVYLIIIPELKSAVLQDVINLGGINEKR